ncbi:bifunctional metallophosphatase/5'-nucleotidase [Demetria terragena]|uniref:bifunctional metallophosphatase/5'-nucleotidase n=1 Tax=Demetria terragena TaxID=63959 RepID=UPI000378D319|nr:bifunctional UDP-sugar hydrolase/5'-nucleotidase [Demetria terragena]
MNRARKFAACGGSLALSALMVAPAHAATNVGDQPIDPALTQLSLVNTNDFHGHFTKDFACAVTTVQREVPGTTFLSAGDNVGGTPFESASQDDEPAIDYLNSLDLKVSAVGNHEFDGGLSDLKGRVQDRADWTYVGANVYRAGTTDPVLPGYKVVEQNGVRIGVIGAVTREVPSLVAKDGIKGLEFGDPVAAVNRVATDLTDGDPANGEADVLVAEYHEGAPSGESSLESQVSSNAQFKSIVTETSPKVAAIFTGHTHQKYAWDGPASTGTRPVIQTDFYASHLGQLTLGYDPARDEVTQYSMTNREVTEPTEACKADPRYTATAKIVDTANKRAEQIGKEKIGTKTAPITRALNDDGTPDNRMRESRLSNLIAQSYVESINKPGRPGGVDIGVMNPGGVRADLGGNDEAITYADAATIMPFNNTIVTKDLTGAQIKQVLEEQWQPEGSSRPFLKLGLSENVTYTYDPNAGDGKRITTVMVDGKELDEKATYTIASNSFLLDGGDNFTTFGEGTNTRDSGLIDQSLFVEWIKENSPIRPPYEKHAVAVTDQPTEVKAGEEFSFTLTGFNMSTTDPNENTQGLAWVDDGPYSGEIGAKAVRLDAPPYPTRDGELKVDLTATGPSRNALVKVRLTETGTTVLFPVKVVAADGPSPTGTTTGSPGDPTGTGSPGDPSGTVSGPPVETGLTGDGSNGATLIGVAGSVTLLGGAYLLARRRMEN